MKNKILFITLIILYILIPILISLYSNLYEIKFYILTFLGLIIYILMKFLKIKNEDIGINNNVLKSIKINITLIIIFSLLIIIIRLIGINKYNPNENICFYIFYIFISCPIQEFLYRGVFGYFEKHLIKNKYFITVLSSLLYSFVHIIYKDFLPCILTFIIGLIWYTLYRKNYNLAGVIISHIVLGILTISLGIVD